jgi:Fur family zinc uptake transcriptional regulator
VVEQTVERMLNTMAGKGMRITEQRKTLARIFAEATGYLTAKEVYERLEMNHKGLSLDTVYRNLRVLQEIGVLEQFDFDDGAKFRIGCTFQNHKHHHHFICLSCDQIYPFDYCPMEHLGELQEHFLVVKHKFEIYGYCKHCIPEAELDSIA